MDFAGRNFWKHQYKTDRPLTEEERTHRYQQKTTRNAPSMDFLSVIKFNSDYIELVDRWYPTIGFAVWLGAAGVFMGLGIVAVAIWVVLFAPTETIAERWVGPLIITPMAIALAIAGTFMLRLEAFRYTHYPMRLNRKTRQVHVFRQNGTVLTVPWDDLFITLGTARAPLPGTTYDLRAHVLDADGKTVRESFSLGYTYPCKPASIDKFWAFLQPYMEAPDGVERTFSHLKKGGYLLPLDGRKEGWCWSIARSFMMYAHWPWLQLLVAPVWGPVTLGRMFAMWTSKQPSWPAEVEQASEVAADDPYVLTWRNNDSLGWWELWYPLLCTVLGVGAFVGVLIAIPLGMFD